MLTLKNIKIADNTAVADYFPESAESPSRISVNVETGDLIELREGDGSWEMYVSHAKDALVEMWKSGDTRTEKVVMWY